MELIPLTARMVMTHLVNHLSHYPLSGGPAILHSLLSENHDNPSVESSELCPDVFRSPNLQLFVFNDSTLISYLQIPAQGKGPGPAAPAEVRVIVRDISGKYSWDGRLLYGPLEGSVPQRGSAGTFSIPRGPEHACPGQSEPEEGEDALEQLLERLGSSSPECLVHPERGLNEAAPPPSALSPEQERAVSEALLLQSARERDFIRSCSSAWALSTACQQPPHPAKPRAPFYFCRLLLNDLGMNSWDRR